MKSIMFNVYMDDCRTGPSSNSSDFIEDWESWIIVRSVENTKHLLEMGVVNNLALDHDMGMNSVDGSENSNGTELVRWMIEKNIWPAGNISIHSSNIYKSKCMKEDIEKYKNVQVQIS